MAQRMTGTEHGSVSVGSEPTPINAVPVTPPVEATLRILLNSVPYLMGVAVVRQPPANDAAIVQVGRMPWLHDRRLTTLSLPDDALPANRALTLDWPVPYQAEWVGAPPRLLIARLVAQGHTVGVLLGTFITREQLAQHTREALDLSCELIASAMAGEFLAPAAPHYPVEVEQSSVFTPAPEPAVETEPETEPQLTIISDTATEVTASEPDTGRSESVSRGDSVDLVVDEVRKSLEDANDARSLGRILRDVMNVITDASAFSISLFHLALTEVAYRYKVLGPEPDASELGRQAVDDGPSCYAARHDRRWHVFQRDLAIRDGATVRHRDVTVLQIPLVGAGEVFGVVTVQTFRADGFFDHELRLIAAVAEVAAPRFGQVRLSGRFQPSASNIPTSADAATAVLPAAAAARPTTQRTTETVLAALLRRCAGAGFATAFLMGVDPGAGMLRGELVSDSEVARELDYALGITAGKFVIPVDERYNAIARAMREARIVPAPTIHEIAQPVLDWQRSLALERLAQGGRTVTLPIVVESEPAGALVLGPMSDDPTFSAIEMVRGYVEDATRELAELWRAESR
ncbi:MAG TPA: GAF domain-containing protein [Candidatus Limnocylindria bacterium]|nr:GAF domain-containing protein [Candidatus Limnocylindria bacterium]